jgi:pimeloyl-ACP methyl ester carboxylesterase
VVVYNPDLTLVGNAAWIAQSLSERTLLIGHSMGGIIASLVGGNHPVLNIEGLPTRPSKGTLQLGAGVEPSAASMLWRSLLAECNPAATSTLAGHYERWLHNNSAATLWRHVKAPKLYVYGEESTADRVHLQVGVGDRIGIPGASHFPMVDRPDALSAIIHAFEQCLEIPRRARL